MLLLQIRTQSRIALLLSLVMLQLSANVFGGGLMSLEMVKLDSHSQTLSSLCKTMQIEGSSIGRQNYLHTLSVQITSW